MSATIYLLRDIFGADATLGVLYWQGRHFYADFQVL